MSAIVENIKTEKLRHVTKIIADNKIVSGCIKCDELLVIFQRSEEVFKGWQFFEDEMYDGIFIEKEKFNVL